MNNSFIVAALIVIATIIASAAPSPAGSGYHVIDTIAVGGATKWDYCSIDETTHRLFVSHGTSVAVIDLATKKLIKEITGQHGVHGIAFAPETKRGFISNGGDNSVVVFDLQTLDVVGNIQVGQKPDAIIYEPFSRRIYAFNAGSSSASVIDPATSTVVGTITLGGGPEFAVSDGAGKLYVNLESESAVNCIDTKSLAVVGRWPLAPCEGPTGMAIDRERSRIFSGGRNKVLDVVDAHSGTVITSLPIGSGVDACAFDPALKFVFASNKDGTITIIEQESADTYRMIDALATCQGSKTMALEESTHLLFVPAAVGEATLGKGKGVFCVLVLGR